MKKPAHYIDNLHFLQEMQVYLTALHKAQKARKETPRIPEYIGECFLQIATRLSYKPNFVNYTFRDEMISDGVENCLTYIHNFNPAKSKNPFGYFTQIIYYAFLRRIGREKKQTYVKYKCMEKMAIDGTVREVGVGHGEHDTTMLNFDNVQDFIKRYDDYSDKRRERRRKVKHVN